MKKNMKKLMALGIAAVTIMGSTMPVFAADPKTGTSTLDNTKEVYTSNTDGTGAWNPGDGQIQLTYDTSNGTWTDSEGVTHANGTYVLRIPTAIKYENMSVGAVNTSNDYDVIVEGVLAAGKKVKVSAETGKSVTIDTPANAQDTITETTTMKGTATANKEGEYSDTNFRTFSAEQVSVMNDQGKVIGTTVKDNIAMAGTAYSAGTYSGTVQYSSALTE